MYKKSKKLLVWCVVVCMLLTNILSMSVFAETRHGGADRYETAAKIAATFEDAEYAVLATGEDFPDALCAAPLAKAYEAPILLTDSKELNSFAKDTLEDLGVKNVIIVGGEKAVSADVEADVEAMGITVERLAGASRIETSLAIAEKLVAKLGEDPEAVMLATAANFPDALSGSPIAAAKGWPILLTNKDAVDADVEAFIGDAKVYVLGGTAVISEAVADKFDSERLSGAERYATNLAILEAFVDDLDFGTVYVATGERFPDALAGAVLAAGYPLVLVGDKLTSDMKAFLEENVKSSTEVVVLGGTAAVSSSVVSAIEAIINGGDLGEIDEVEATTDTVDNTSEGQVLEFTVNGKEVTVEDMEDEGYDVEFQASEDVFNTSHRNQSSTGILDGDELQDIYEDWDTGEGSRTFKYQVIITKDDDEWESNSKTVTIVDKALDVEEIGDVEVICEDGDFTLNSTTLVMGEDYHFGDIAATVADGVEIDNIAEAEDYVVRFDTSDPNILAVDNNGNLTPNSVGKATITVSSGSAEKDIEFTIKSEQRVATSVEFSEDSIKIARGAYDPYRVELTVIDQYGDPTPGIDLRNFADIDISSGLIMREDINDNMDWDNTIAVVEDYDYGYWDHDTHKWVETDEEYTDEDGVASILFWTKDITREDGNGDDFGVGTGTLTLHRRGSSKKLASMDITTSSDNKVDNYKIQLVYDNWLRWVKERIQVGRNQWKDHWDLVGYTVTDFTDTDFDREVGDDNDTLVLNGYTKNGYFIGHVPAVFYSDRLSNEDWAYIANTNEEVVSADEDSFVPLSGVFDVEINGKGTAKMEAYMDGRRLAYVTYNVSDKSTDIGRSTFSDLTITETNNAPFDVKRDIIDKLVLTTGETVCYQVVNDDDREEANHSSHTVVLYTDDDDNGYFNADEDDIVGMIKVTSNVYNYDDEDLELGAQQVEVSFYQDDNDAEYDDNPVMFGKTDNDDDVTSFDNGDSGKIYFTLYRGIDDTDQAVDTTVITVDVD